MNQRDAIFVLAGIVLATGFAAILLIGTMASPPPNEGRPRFYVNFAGRAAPSAKPNFEVERGVPPPFRAFLPFQRGVSDAARDAAGYLLILLGVAATLVLARDQVLATYHAAHGGWRSQLRVFGTGLAMLLLLASAGFLSSVVLLGTIASGFREVPVGIQFGLQIGLMATSVFGALVILVTLVGFTAAAWRLGDTIFGARPFATWGPRIPAALVALIGATILYLLIQLPLIGGALAALIVAYALGAVIVARLGHVTAGERATTTM